jgi:DNA-binding NarL/FixJ family response regulator
MQGDKEDCLKAGMDAFIPKPITLQALQETIQQVMDPTPLMPSVAEKYSASITSGSAYDE